MGIKIDTIIVTIVDVSNIIHEHTHEALDYLSFHLCPDRPSHKLAIDNLHIPEEDLAFLMQVLQLIWEALGLVIVPFKMLNDKKFTVHIYETATVFTLQNNQQIQNIVPTCDKIFIYIAQNKSKIIEPSNKQIIKTVSINNDDYDIPINFWYSFNIDTDHKVYFFAHVSAISSYKGVVVAVDYKNATSLSLMKDQAIDFYNQTLGSPAATVCTDKKMDFI